MNIFDLFDNSTANELLALLPKDKLSNVGHNVVVNKLDFTKKEDLDKLVEAVDTFKKADSGLLGMVKTLVGDSLDTTLDNVVKAAQQEYAKAHKDDTVKTNKLVGAIPVRKEVDKSTLGVGSPVPVRPSDKTPEEMKKQFVKLVQDYISEKIKPTANLSDKQYKSISDGLFEFACWIYNR